MADRGNRVEVRYGAFSCAIEGYADPVAQLREVLALMQRMIAETPALAEHDAGLDDAGFARLDHALAELRARGGAADQGVIIIRSGQRIAGDAEDAEILAGGARREAAEEEAVLPWRGAARAAEAAEESGADARPHPSGVLYAAPAAAAAEAAFAAGMTADDAQAPAGAPVEAPESPIEGPTEEPLGHEVPGEAATAAALYAAPAADVAARAFSRDRGDRDGGGDAGRGAARPADPADDYDDRDPIWGDEAAAERVDRAGAPTPAPAVDDRDGPGMALGDPGGEASGRRNGDATGPDSGAAGGFGEPAQAEDPPAGGWRLSEAKAEAGRETAGTRARVNIFAPPPAEQAQHWPAERAEDAAPVRPGPLADRPHREGAALPDAEPRDAWRGIDGGAAPGEPNERGAADAARSYDRSHVRADDRAEDRADDDLGDDWGGDWVDELADQGDGRRAPGEADEAGDAGDAGADSTENRLAALITRYQSGAGAARDDEHGHAAAAGISAAALAERAGATEVADLLAVSAAWLTLAGGRPRFSRREVMEVFEMLPGEHLRTLEARIKGFGKLVRSGTLMLVEDGAFAMPPRERERFRELIDQG